MNAKDKMQIFRLNRPVIDRFEDLHPGQVFSVCNQAGDLYMKIVHYNEYNAVSLDRACLEIFEDDVDVQVHLAELRVE